MLLSPYQNRRWNSDLLTIRRLLAAGALGEVRRFESAFERWDDQPEPPAAGGGLLRDFGSHLVDQALHLFGPVRSVYAETHEVRPESEDDVLVLLQHAAGSGAPPATRWSQERGKCDFGMTACTPMVRSTTWETTKSAAAER